MVRDLAGSSPVTLPNFIHAPVAQQVDARDLGSRPFGGCRFESDPGYAGSSSPTAEAAPSSSVKCRFESGDEYKYICPGSSADRATVYEAGGRRFESFLGHEVAMHLEWASTPDREAWHLPVGCVGCTTVFQTVRSGSSPGTGSVPR